MWECRQGCIFSILVFNAAILTSLQKVIVEREVDLTAHLSVTVTKYRREGI